MNPRPILIATCIAIALVAVVYFVGQQHFSSPSADEDMIINHYGPTMPTSEHTTVGNSETKSTPATNSEQTTSVTEQPAETVNTDATQVAETPTTTPNHESDDSPTNPALSERLRERLRLFNAYTALQEEINSYGGLPDEKTFKDYDAYLEALGKYLDIVIPLSERADELHKQYLRISYTPEEFAKEAARFRQQIRQHDPDITDEEINNFIEEIKPQ